MREKVFELMKLLAVSEDDAPMVEKVITSWIAKNSVYISGVFTTDPTLLGEQKQMDFVKKIKTEALKMGELAIQKCGNYDSEPANLSHAKDHHHVEFLCWNIKKEKPKEVQKPRLVT